MMDSGLETISEAADPTARTTHAARLRSILKIRARQMRPAIEARLRRRGVVGVGRS
jgi:ABC-type Fe3+ transport system permease subunit